MKEYITKDRAKQFVCGHCNEVCSEKPCEPSACDWMVFIDKEPAADVVEVVRCCNCEFHDHGGTSGYCNYWRRWSNMSDFAVAANEKGEKVLTMSKEYIERWHAVDAVLDVYCDTPDIDLSCEKFEAAILKIPAADVAPVRHGRWEKHGSKWQCTGCKVLMSIDGTPQENLLYYCPNCGAYMMGENNGKCE